MLEREGFRAEDVDRHRGHDVSIRPKHSSSFELQICVSFILG